MSFIGLKAGQNIKPYPYSFTSSSEFNAYVQAWRTILKIEINANHYPFDYYNGVQNNWNHYLGPPPQQFFEGTPAFHFSDDKPSLQNNSTQLVGIDGKYNNFVFDDNSTDSFFSFRKNQ